MRRPAKKNFVAIRKVAFTTPAKKITLTVRVDERFMSALPRPDDMPVGSSEFFCSNSRCTFHVRVGDRNVRGFGFCAVPSGTSVFLGIGCWPVRGATGACTSLTLTHWWQG